MRAVVVAVVVGVLGAGSALAAEPLARPFEPVERGPVYTSGDARRQPAVTAPGRLHREPGMRLAFELPGDPFLGKQWYLYNVGQPDEKGQPGVPGADVKAFPALQAWAPTTDAVLAVVDSGLDLGHEDLSARCLWTNPGETGRDAEGRDKAANGADDDANGYVDDVHGWSFVEGSNDVQDRHYHGTHVNGLLSAVWGNGLGMAGGFPGVKVMVVKIFGLGATATSEQIAAGLRYAADNGARVLSCSWGSAYPSDAVREAIRYCGLRGALVVCAAGNSRKNLVLEPDYPACYGLENQVVVGASDNRDVDALFANYGPTVDLAAPGRLVFSLMPGSKYRALSGTSQACPMVAAALAMVLAQEPSLTVAAAKARLLRTADKRTALARWVTSAGRLNVWKLLQDVEGEPLPEVPTEGWIERPWAVESPHPYAYDTHLAWTVQVPGARWVRVHFTRFELDNFDDVATLEDGAGAVVERWNVEDGGSFWSAAVPGDAAVLRLDTDQSINRYGLSVDRVAFVPGERPAGR